MKKEACMDLIPKGLFFTSGVGIHKERLVSFELALKDARVNHLNLVPVSSIVPPGCQVVSADEGVRRLKPGAVTFCVAAWISSNEPGRTVTSAVGMCSPKDQAMHGYLSEHHAFDESEELAKEYTEYLAALMFMNTNGIPEGTGLSWSANKVIWMETNRILRLESVVKSAIVSLGTYTTVFAGAIFLW